MECPACGNRNREGARYCDSCGFELAPGESVPAQAADAAPRNGDASSPGPQMALAPAAPADAPDSIAGRYDVGRFLGRGGRKDVYLAHDTETGREVAVALFDTEGLGEAALARARREMHAMEKLGDHPHLVSVHDTGEADGRPYIVSRYMPGGDVQRLLASSEGGRLDPQRAIGIGIDVCRALEHAHSRGIVHRDLKPANVWLAEDGSGRLGDFSLAGSGGRGSEGTLVGTVAYMPPERALGRPSGPPADLYSLGALLYEMVAGQPPFTGGDAVSIIGRHLNADPVAPSHHNPAVPAALDEMILGLLAKSPGDRPGSAADVRVALEAARDSRGQPEEAQAEENPLEGLAGRVFVGREAELAQLREAADETLAGRGRLVLIAGEPGIGKTRTAEELATYAQVRGANVHWGRCHEDEGAPAYWPWVQAIRSYVREADPVALAWEMGSGAADIARVVPEVAERVGEAGAPQEADDEAARFRLFDSISGFLGGASGSRPLVIVLDDLHWADEPSLLLLQFLARGLGDGRLLLIGTYRDVELGRHHPLSRMLGDISGSGEASRVVLHGLSEPDVGSYIERTAGAVPAPALVSAVHDQTEGNPFFLAEVVRLLAAEGTLDAPATASLAIPQGVRDVIGRRLDRLSAEANEALAVAAAIGRDFDAGVLTRVAGADRDTVEEALAGAASAQLLAQTSAGRYRFSHALVRETLYEELSAAQRPALHLRIAEALEELYSSDPARLQRRLAEVAHHYLEAAAGGDASKAVDYAVRAARSATGQLGHEEAAELYERALETLELCDPDRQRHTELLVALGEAQTKAGKLAEARGTLDRAADAALELGSTGLVVRSAFGLAYVSEVGSRDERVIEVVEAALDRVGDEDSLERARLYSWLAQELIWDQQGRAKELFEAANEMARRLGDERTLAFTLSRGAFIDLEPDGARQLVEIQTEVIELARRVGDRELELRAHVLRLAGHLSLGDVAAVDRDLEVYARLASELRQPQHLWHVPLLRGMRATIDGRFDAAEEFAAEARAGGERAQEPLAQQFFAIQAALRYRLEGRLEEIASAIEQLAARYPAISAWRTAAALTHADLGQLDEARAEFERLAADDFAALPKVVAQWMPSIAILSEIAAKLGDAGRAEKLHSLFEPYRGQVVVAGRAAASWGPVSRYLGLSSEAAGRLDQAAGELEDAIALSERMGDRPFLAQSHLNLACVLLKRDSRGDRERALELLDRCLDASQEMGMAALSEQALASKLEAQGLAGVDATTSIDEVIAAVESERPDIRAHAAPDGTVTILFSDIEDSTVLNERLGDERWLELLRSHNAIFRQRLRAHDGYEVKNQGDGFMLVFPRPAAALRCAIEVQRALAERVGGSAEEAIRVRMGLHTGEAIAEEGDFFGRNVVLAARIAAQAAGAEILVSEALREQAEGEDGLAFGEGRELELKGMAGTHTVHRAEWEAEAATA
ncbi:MAG: protein kinase domain-containing protein [Solirubrobacterales bacterium]